MIAPIDLDAVSASFVGGPVVFTIVAAGSLIASIGFVAAMVVKVMTFFDDRARQRYADQVARWDSWRAEQRAANPNFGQALSGYSGGSGASSESSASSDSGGIDVSDVVSAVLVADLFSSDSSSSSSSLDSSESSFSGGGGSFGGGGSSGDW